MSVTTALHVIPARDIREGDMLRGYYVPSVTLDTAARPGSYAPDWSDIDRRPALLPIPDRAARPGPAAFADFAVHHITDDSPVVVTREPISNTRRGCMTNREEDEAFVEAIGRIAGFAAASLHEGFPHLDLDGLIETFTRPSAFSMLGTRYLNGLKRGLTPGQSAGEAGAALIRLWADSRLEARALLDSQKAANA
ncbi:hypothetical protein AB0A05_07440 [Streptomyces sp. NPDC046374]|uniref:hypothetical protein n=1 Tax=Streptomyces sp. NPDC046374 TaxID=3154917 RepID=UPI0033E018BE